MVFNSCFDIIGPIMVGPSSSHTAGVVAIGKFGHDLLGTVPDVADISFYDSFSETYQGHGTDKAIVGGLLGFNPDHSGIKHAFELANKQKMHVTFQLNDTCPYYDHPNTLVVKMKKGDSQITFGGVSLGGGVSKIFLIDGHPVDILLNSHIDFEQIRKKYLSTL